MSRPLSFRRAQKNRALHKAYRIVLNWYPISSFYCSGHYFSRKLFMPEDRWNIARRIAKNRKCCSGDCCKNPRRAGWDTKGTIQEQKALEDYYFQLEDMLG